MYQQFAMSIIVVVMVLIVGLLGYVRLSWVDPTRWHAELTFDANRDLASGAQRVVAAGPNGLQTLNEIALASPRTTVLAGSVDSGRITYVARSAVIGFPDYITVQQSGDVLKLFSRLRFGRSDFGVNKDRVDGWITQLQM